MSLYRIAKIIVSTLFYPLYRIKVVGKENIPTKGPVIICSNHISNLDPPVIGITSPRVIHFMAKEELFEKTFSRKLLTGIHAFPVRRGMADRNALRTGLKILKEGKVLGLFPEGTRSRTGKPGKPLAGVGFFALRSDAVVIPCAIKSSYKPFKRTIVTYGEPVEMNELRKQKASAQETADTIMKEIKNLLNLS
ncbi:1-acyl-sn-glycerol-3-phosphate acyltransferase [Cerasibacillus quisquiliarum]|uniref:1-acyl-sn-glycerol-3-phosphate acyltransferase n=1 Tax=Cerasibacillus quisquiliarum TaxID=227865 RepID=A0A511UYW0_9BACI|nr:lysophospholipid acyltransferase family protein [Cerasibacillus quisquiliarum]MBB5145389.1 1-acyl-sn-glycerol-3-phosphate acyltransferase [Cerasibacillus quisquiliarum]GEN31825.1 1-acyl-sn-glycerol-3-phosphate acyltransferase [Cerasibacillus quisquiliarum]